MSEDTASAEVLHFTVAERIACGRAARDEAARSDHATLDVQENRNPIGVLEAQAAPRVRELLPIRYGRMLASPFTFYRGGAALMGGDLAPTPRAGLHVQLCGDAHLLNFGGYASPERYLVFGINDFDETLPGPFEWDVKRLATSAEIAGRDRDFGRADRRAAALAAVRGIFRTYRRSLQSDGRDLLEEFRFADLARRVVGIASVGLRSWVMLLLGRDEADPLSQVDDGDGAKRDFYVRQLRDWKLSIDLTKILPRALAIYARWCGATLARAHARSGDRIAIAAYLGKSDVFDRAVADFAKAYADLNEQDHAALAAAVGDGRLPATEGV